MKILPKHHHITPSAYGIIILGILLVLIFPYTIAFSFKAHILFLILAIFTLLAPWTYKKANLTQTAVTKNNLITCVAITWLIQLTLMLAFYSITHLTAITLPINILPFPLFQITFSILLLEWGLFPWGLCALVAAWLGYVGYVKKQAGNMSTLVRPLLKNQTADSLSLIADVSTKIAIAFSLAITLALTSMECMGLIGTFFNLPMGYGMRLDTLLIMLLVLQSSKSDFFELKIPQLLKRRSPIFLTVAVAVVMILILLLLSVLIALLSPTFTPLLNRVLDFAPEDWAAVWLIFTGVWWLSWIPLTAGMLAYVWRGYRGCTLIIWTLVLPFAAGIVQLRYPQWLVDISVSLTTHWFNFIPALLSTATLMWLFLRKRTITYAVRATLPDLTHTYHRSPVLFVKRTLQLIVVFMGLYWMGGIYVPGIIYFALVFLTGMLIFVAGIAGVRK